MSMVPAGAAAADGSEPGSTSGSLHPGPGPGLIRGLGLWDCVLLTIGSVIGTGIYLTPGDMAKDLPHAGLMLLVWAAGGLLGLAGALTFAELGVLYPRAGGIYQYLKEVYGPVWGFLYGWTAFLVIMSGGIAALCVALRGEPRRVFPLFFSSPPPPRA